jgi:uncharacterized protein
VIQLRVRLRPDGCLAGFAASGHAGAGPRGRDPVCAAVTVLLRTSARVLSSRSDLRVSGLAPAEGDMRLEMEPPPQALREWVRGVTAMLMAGLTDLDREFPGRLKLEVGEEGDGT